MMWFKRSLYISAHVAATDLTDLEELAALVAIAP